MVTTRWVISKNEFDIKIRKHDPCRVFVVRFRIVTSGNPVGGVKGCLCQTKSTIQLVLVNPKGSCLIHGKWPKVKFPNLPKFLRFTKLFKDCVFFLRFRQKYQINLYSFSVSPFVFLEDFRVYTTHLVTKVNDSGKAHDLWLDSWNVHNKLLLWLRLSSYKNRRKIITSLSSLYTTSDGS